jgi:hypothetical protein
MKRPVEGALIHSLGNTLPGQLLAMVSGKKPNEELFPSQRKPLDKQALNTTKALPFAQCLAGFKNEGDEVNE